MFQSVEPLFDRGA